jgi:hypothetical protein
MGFPQNKKKNLIWAFRNCGFLCPNIFVDSPSLFWAIFLPLPCFLSGIFHFSQPPRSSEQGADYEPWRMAHGPRMTSMNGMYEFR